MANPNPTLENLEKGRGKKPKIGHKPFTINMLPFEKNNLDQIAQSFGCVHGHKGSLSCLLSKIANEELIVVSSPPSWKTEQQETELPLPDPQKTIDDDLHQEIFRNERDNCDAIQEMKKK